MTDAKAGNAKLNELTVVAYWGGLCRAIDATGKTIAQTQLPNDVTSMIATNDKLIVGLANGAVMALTIK